MSVLVTGASGQLGSDLVPRLERAGLEVTAFSSAECDITDPDRVAEAVKEARPEVIINTAAYTKVDLAEKEIDLAYAVNRDGAGTIARAAEAAGAVVVHISTDFVFDGRRPEPYTEDDPTGPLGVYGASKLAGEVAVAAACPRHVIVRTSWLYGSGGGGNFVRTMLRLATERERLRVVYDQTGSPTWTADLAGALVAITVRLTAGGGGGGWDGGGGGGREIKKPWGVYHYSNDGVASWFDLAVAAVVEARANGVPVLCREIEPIRTIEYPTPAERPAYSVFDKQKIKRVFGISIPHWRESLKLMVAEVSGGR
jgi:dTDP-4-dehydrorhamnose reductase